MPEGTTPARGTPVTDCLEYPTGYGMNIKRSVFEQLEYFYGLTPAAVLSYLDLVLYCNEWEIAGPIHRNVVLARCRRSRRIARVLERSGLLTPWGDGWHLKVIPGIETATLIRSRRLPRATRQAVMDRDGRRCQHCGATDNLTIDHIHPVSRGGSDDMDNLQVLCAWCNTSKGAR